MKYRVYTFFFTLLLLACNNNYTDIAEEADVTVSIDPLKTETVTYSAVFEGVEYISIPSDSNFLIGEADKMAVAGKYIFIMDKYITKSVFALDRQGKNKFVINAQGNGPGEYLAMKDIYYDSTLNAVGIHCVMQKKYCITICKANT
jgi:hypothetical protein